MIFQKISHRIAWQFTAFVFGLLLIAGSIFIAADMVNRDRMIQGRLERQIRLLMDRPDAIGSNPQLPPFQRDRTRIVDASGNSLFSGTFFENIPFEAGNNVTTTVTNDDESYAIFTMPVTQNGEVAGYIQVADHAQPDDLFFRILLYLLISIGISGLTFGVGLFFARRSLRPAEQMMERLEQFTQDASHELRTPLTAVSTSLDLALATNDYPENVRNAKSDLKEMSVLIERLLELARLDTYLLQKEDVDLSALVLDGVEKHRPFALEKNITIDVEVASHIHTEGDPTLLKQVLSNLLTNAIKFNKATGKIVVKLTPHTLSVHDTGKGIAEASLPHVFDRFYQEDPSRTNAKEGIGLGLALVKRIVDLHGWTIAVHSKPKDGTTFTVHLHTTKHGGH